MREPEGIYKLCIHDPQKLDSGRYIVEASNKAGKEEIRRTIRFLGKEHYKYLPGIRHADPKKPHEPTDEGEIIVEAPIIEEEEDAMVFYEILFKVFFVNLFFLGQMGKFETKKRKKNSSTRESFLTAITGKISRRKFIAETSSQSY